MFGQYFGNYLVEKNKISQSQLEDILTRQVSHVKLGLIAVSEKLLTTKQAEEVNMLQKQEDKRFGDIAIEKGYLLTEEVTYLLNMQGNSYLKFVQALTENNLLSIEEIEIQLYNFKKDYNYSDSDIDALKSGDIERIIPIFVEHNLPYIDECITLIIRNITRFISNNIIIKQSYYVHEYKCEHLACQQLIGNPQLFIGFSGQGDTLLQIANPFAKENFLEINDDAFDSVCEFINCSNGIFASKLSLEEIHTDMTPPIFYKNITISSQGNLMILPIILSGKEIELIIAMNSLVEIN